MNLKLFDNLIRPKGLPSQKRSEWRMFLEICEMYLTKHNIENPIVVELGTGRNKQKKFWERLFAAEHIGIDISDKRGIPDILGDLHDPEITEKIKERLGGRPINILFIDANHSYEAVKRDFEIYSPLCSDIIVLHDIETNRYEENKKNEVWKFWDELREKAYRGVEEYKDFLLLSIYQHHIRGQLGIGMIIKNG